MPTTEKTSSNFSPGVWNFLLCLGAALLVFWIFEILHNGFNNVIGFGTGTSALAIGAGVAIRVGVSGSKYVWLGVAVVALICSAALYVFALP